MDSTRPTWALTSSFCLSINEVSTVKIMLLVDAQAKVNKLVLKVEMWNHLLLFQISGVLEL